MPVDPAKAVGFEMPVSKGEWSQDDVILYHLGVGAGVPPTDPNELAYTYEGNLKVLPSYGVIPVSGALTGMAGIPGVDINFALVLHGEQDLEIRKTLPTQAKVVHKSRVADIFDKGRRGCSVRESVLHLCPRGRWFRRGIRAEGGQSGPGQEARLPEGVGDAAATGVALSLERRQEPSARGSGVCQDGWF